MTRNWRPGDRALLPVVVTEARESGWATVEMRHTSFNVFASDLLPDDRRPDWLPGQPGDVALIAGEHRLRDKDGWWLSPEADAVVMVDDDVPADAVLVLPARTREVES